MNPFLGSQTKRPTSSIANKKNLGYHRLELWETESMSTSKGFLQNLLALVAVVMAIVMPVQPALAAVTVGQTASADARVDGIRVPSGTTLISPAVVETGDKAAVLHLSNGEVVAVAPYSTAVLASVDSGIQLAVERGNVAYTNNDGALETISTTETILVAQQGQIQEGERISSEDDDVEESEERLCELQDWTADQWRDCRFDDPDKKDQDGDDRDDEACDWELLEVPMSQVPQYLEKTAVLACKDRNDLDFDCNCKKAALIVWWIPVAAVAGGAAIYELVEGDDEKAASPTTP